MEALASLAVRIGADISEFRNKMAQVRDTIANVGKTISGLATSIVGLTALKGIKINADIEQAHIAFTTLLKDGAKADQMIKELQKLAAQSPFEFEGLQTGAKLLLAMGIDAQKVIPYMYKIGDAVAAVGGNQVTLERVARALAQINAKGKLSAEEMNQLAENGIPAWDILADKMHLSVEQLMQMDKQGQLLAKDVIPALIEGMGDRFGGAMQKQSQTFSGMMSTLKDNANIILGNLFKPLFDSAKKYLSLVTNLTNDFVSGLQSGGLAKAIENLIPANLRPKVEMFKGWVNAVKYELKKQDWDGVGALIGLKIKEGIEAIKGLGKKLADKVSSEFNSIDWNNILNDVSNGINDFALGFIRMFDTKLSDNIKNGNWQAVGQQLGEMLAHGLESLGKSSGKLIEGLEKLVKSIDWYALGLKLGKTAIPFILGFFEGLFDFDIEGLVKEHWEGILATMLTVITLPENWALRLATKLDKIPFVGPILSWITSRLNQLGGPIRERIGVLVDGIGKSFSEGFSKALKSDGIIATILRPFREGLPKLIDWIDTKILQINQKLSSWANKLGNIFGQAADWARTKFNNGVNKIYGIFDNFLARAGKFISDIINKFKNMKISIPKPKLPDVSVTIEYKKIGSISIPYPKFNVTWHAKGGIFAGPSVIGVGEAGPEAVVPLSGSRMRPFAKAIAEEMGGAGHTFNINVYTDDRRTGRTIARTINRELWLHA